MEKPLFIPLAAKWFEAFERGEKGEEYRINGPRWNAQTCRVGREVVLSYGYGKARRLTGRVSSFKLVSPDHHPSIREVWPDAGMTIAAIGITLDR